MESPFASWMDRLYLEFPDRVSPDEGSDELQLYADAGISHEAAFVKELETQGSDLCWIKGDNRKETAAATQKAIAEGREIIFQAYLRLPPFAGYADFLARVSTDPILYEVGHEARKDGKAILPDPALLLCRNAGSSSGTTTRVCGSHSSGQLQTGHVFAPMTIGFTTSSLKGAFLQQMAEFHPDADHPVPDPRADHGRWQSHAEEWLLDRDHLFQVANISVSQILKLNQAGIETVAQLAKSKKSRVPRLNDDSYHRLVSQASIQMKTRAAQANVQVVSEVRPAFQVLRQDQVNPRSGLALLPPASRQDIYFDIEGFPLFEGGLEYLLGAVTVEKKKPRFHDWRMTRRKKNLRLSSLLTG